MELSHDSAGPGIGDWREIAEWDWVQQEDDDGLLHAVGDLDNAATADDDWHGEGRTACGIVGILRIPGIFSRMSEPRCPACCEATGMPQGAQSPKNIDECRPVVAARIAALTRPTERIVR